MKDTKPISALTMSQQLHILAGGVSHRLAASFMTITQVLIHVAVVSLLFLIGVHGLSRVLYLSCVMSYVHDTNASVCLDFFSAGSRSQALHVFSYLFVNWYALSLLLSFSH